MLGDTIEPFQRRSISKDSRPVIFPSTVVREADVAEIWSEHSFMGLALPLVAVRAGAARTGTTTCAEAGGYSITAIAGHAITRRSCGALE